MSILMLLILLLVFAVVVYVVFWGVDAAGIPAPINWIVKAVVLIVALLFLLQKAGMSVPGL